jgi:hypothetical protein
VREILTEKFRSERDKHPELREKHPEKQQHPQHPYVTQPAINIRLQNSINKTDIKSGKRKLLRKKRYFDLKQQS